MPFYSHRKLLIRYSIAIGLVLLVLLYTLSVHRSQEKQLGIVQITRETMQKLEPAIIHLQQFERDLNNFILSNEEKNQPDFFSSGITNLRKDSLNLIEISFSDSILGEAKDYQQLSNYLHQVMNIASFIIDQKRTYGIAAAKAELQKGEGLRILNDFNELVDKLESKNRFVLSAAYSRNTILAGRTYLFAAIIGALLIAILIISFWISYKETKNRIFYYQNLEKQVKEKTAEISNIYERVTDAFIALDKEWRYTYLNKKACEMHGRKAEELLGKNIWSEFPDVSNEPFYNALHEAMKKQEPMRLEMYYSTTGKWFEDLIYPSPDGISVYYHDITEKKKAEIKVAESEEKYRTIIEQASDGIFIADQNEFIIDVNSYGCSMMGYTKEELKKTKFSELIAPENRKNDPIRYKELNSGNTVLNERRLIRKNGSEIEVEISAKKLSDGRYQSILRDITDRKKTDKLIKWEKEFSDSIINSMPGVFYLLDENVKFLRWNKNFETITGYSADEIANMHPLEFFDEDEKPLIEENIGKVLTEGIVFFEANFYSKDHKKTPLYFTGFKTELYGQTHLIGVGIDITDRKKTEETLINNELRFRTLAGNAPVGIFQTDAGGKTTYVNETWMGYTGMKFHEAIGDGWIEAVHPGDRERLIKDWYDKAHRGFESTTEYRLIHKDGTTRWVSGKAVPIFNKSGEIAGYIGTLSDFTDRKKAELELRASEETRKLIMQSALDAIVCMDISGAITVWTQQAEKIFGWKDEEVIGKNLSETIIPVTYRKKHAEGLKHYLKTGEGPVLNKIIEITAINHNGEEFPIELSVIPIKQDRTEFFCAFIRDITQRKLAEKAIIESEEKYRTLVDQAGDAIAMFDRSGKFIDVNSSAVLLLQYTKEEFDNLNIKDIFYGDELEKQPVRFDLLESGESTIKQRQLKRKDGSPLDSEVHTRMLHDGRFLSVVRDLTERNKAKHQIEKERNLSDSVINSLPGVFFLQDRSGKFLRWNKEFEAVSGYNSNEISKLKPSDFYEEKEKAVILKKIEEVFINGSGDMEIMIINKSGKKIPFYFTAQLIQYEGMPCLIGTGIDITERKMAQEELERSYKSIRQLTEHLQNIREEERINIAREIHDELGQQLTVLKMDISWLKKKLAKTDTEAVEKINDLLKLTDTTIKSVRKISSDLRPSLLDDLGLVAAIEWQLKEFESRSSVKTSFTTTETERDLPDSIKTTFFRIFQESLTNVARHSKASNVKVSLKYRENNFVLTIEDDGKGFDKHKIADKRTLGLLGMKERTAMTGGAYDIISAPGKGTTIVVTIPLNNNDQPGKA
ncbi:MAG: PAS domain S-box protein [Bacteroidota bacterium]